jgi:hypothetical protein
MGEPASNLPSSGGNKKARSSSFGISINCVGGPSRVGLGVWLGNLCSLGLWVITIAMETKRRERRAKKNWIRGLIRQQALEWLEFSIDNRHLIRAR